MPSKSLSKLIYSIVLLLDLFKKKDIVDQYNAYKGKNLFQAHAPQCLSNVFNILHNQLAKQQFEVFLR